MIPTHIGRYRVLDLVGQGAMGVVYRGRDETLDRDVALKVMQAETADADSIARFHREAKAAARLQHPNIVTIYELGDHEGAPFMAMELLEGVDLQRAIEGGLRPNPRVTLPIVLQLLAGLGHAHENGIVHRDVKPSNIFLPRGRPAKIMDFGVARLGGGATSVGLMVGTPNYMSPEQVRAHPVDGRSDLFSAGLILYELVTGEKAYRADSVVAVLYKIAHEAPDFRLLPRGAQWERLRRVLERALASEPDRRFADAGGMAAELALALQELGGSVDGAAASDRGVMRTARRPGSARGAGTPLATPVPPPERTTPPPPRVPAPAAGRGLMAGIAGGLALLLVAGGVVLSRLGPGSAGLAPGSLPTTPATTAPTPAVPSAVPPSPRTETTAAPPPSPVPSPQAVTSPAPAASPREGAVRSPLPTPTLPSPARSPSARPGPSEERLGDEAVTPGGVRLEKANALYEQGRYNAALAEARAVLRQWPGNAEARTLVEDIEADVAVESRLKQAREALKRGDREAALEHVRAGLAVRSTDARLIALFRELTQ